VPIDINMVNVAGIIRKRLDQAIATRNQLELL
jgi:hypothetical protein